MSETRNLLAVFVAAILAAIITSNGGTVECVLGQMRSYAWRGYTYSCSWSDLAPEDKWIHQRLTGPRGLDVRWKTQSYR